MALLSRILAFVLLFFAFGNSADAAPPSGVKSIAATGEVAISGGNDSASAGCTVAIPFSALGAKVMADYKGDAISTHATHEGAYLYTEFQKLSGTVTREGLTLESISDKGGRLHLTASAIGRGDASCQLATVAALSLPRTGTVVVAGKLVTFARPGLTEEYSVSVDGVRQDFIVAERPGGMGHLSLTLDVTGATAEAADYGAKLTLVDSGRALAYSRLRVTDAKGRKLAARLEVVSPSRLTVRVSDGDAAYPVRIDPTFSDANWVSLSSGVVGTAGAVSATAVDGSGNLYVGGSFNVAGNVRVNHVAKWDGSSWSGLGSGTDGDVTALLVSGGNLYAGGAFTTAGGTAANRIAKWDGSSWSALGVGISGSVSALAIDSGGNLYAGGLFVTAGGVSASRIAKWEGANWSALGTGLNSSVNSIVTIGTDVYAGGIFTTAGGASANRIAKWNGASWSALGTGLSGTVNALAVSGTTVYAAGTFTTAGGISASNIAAWNGSTWSALGSGINSTVSALLVNGTDLYAGGSFGSAGGVTANRMAKWNGSTWSALGSGIGGNVRSLAMSGTTLYAGGFYTATGALLPARNITRWNGTTWSVMGSGIDDTVRAILPVGSSLYVAGNFTKIGGVAANRIALWNGTAWSALGTGLSNTAGSLAVMGSDLYVGGSFTTAGGVAANYIAKWNGSSWSALGTGMNNAVNVLAVIGTNLYAGGAFTTAGGITVNRIAKWDGSAWSALGTGMDNSISTLAVIGTNLYAGGSFTTAGGVSASRVAKWDGSVWTALGSGMSTSNVSAMTVVGTDLYAAGAFTTAGGVTVNNIAKWNGSAWSALGTGLNNIALALASSSTDVYVGGAFTTAGGVTASWIAKWDGSAWSALGSGVDNTVSVLAADTAGHLFLAGGFGLAGQTVSPFIAQANLAAPDIVVEQPSGTSIADGGTRSFGNVLTGGSSSLTFTIRNPGTAALTGLGITIDGTDASQFSVTASPTAPVAEGGSTTFTVQFTPTSIGGKTAALHIASSALGTKNPYDITLSGTAYTGSPISGTRLVGPTGTYSSIGAALTDIALSTLGGPMVLELQPAYSATAEAFPITFSNLGTTATNTLTLRPQSGATALSISSADTTTATVDLNGAQFVTIDGRPGGAGSNAGSGGGAASQLTIANTSTSGVAVRFINEASGNTLRYTTLRGVNSSATSGVVVFSTTTGGNGNDNNTIDHCDIRDGASTPTNGIYALGTTTTTAANNSGNTVSNCNVLNFYSINGAAAAGVRLDGGNTDWTLTGNSFYQSASRAAVSLSFSRPIYVNNTSGNNFTVTGNFIGGSAPNAGGTAWTTTGTANAYQFVGIHLNVGNTTASSVQGNTIQNIAWTTSSNSNNVSLAPWIGIFVSAGSANVGTVTGNTIGSGTGTGSISVTTSGTGGTTFGIGSASTGTVSIAKNTIGSITTNGTATTISASLVGIQVTAGANTISNNLVGSLTTANSLNAATSSTSGTGQQVAGIVSSSSGSVSITGNTLANLNNNYIGTTTGQVRGIATTAGVNTINGNTVRNFSSINPTSLPPTSSSVLGIIQTSTVAGQTVSRNVVHSLSNTAATGSVSVIGIYYAGNTTAGPNIIAQNLVHSLAITSTSLTTLEGMEFAGGTFTAQNNMVRVGLDANGVSTGGGANLRGIYDNGTTAGRNFYHNSVYSAGTQTNGANATIAFQSTGATNAREFRNNIFVSTRTRGGTATSSYVAVTYGGTTANPAGLTASNNIFFVSGTGSLLGIYNGASISTLSAWQAATGMDTLSLNADPVFVNPTGSAATVDLHVQGASPANSAAAVIATVTDDMDSQARNATFPDIGADEFDANEIGVEQPAGTGLTDGSSTVAFGLAPVGGSTVRTFTVRNIGNLNLTLGTITGDGTDAAAFTVNTAGMSTTLPPGGSTTFAVTFAPASAGAKTAALHIASNDPNENPFDITLTGYGVSNAPLSGTKTVGPTGTYASVGSAIFDIQSAGLGGALVLELQPAYVSAVETFPLIFTNLGTTPVNTLTIRPASGATALSITSADTTAATVDLKGAQFVTIDGRPGGAGSNAGSGGGAASELTIANTSTSGVAVRFINEASGNTLRYTTLRGVNSSATSGVVVFSTTTGGNGNDNNTIDHCDIRDGASTPTNGIYALGTTTTTAANNSGNTVSNCNILNFYAAAAVDSAGVRLDGGNTDWTISGNSFYQTVARAGQGANVQAIHVNNVSGNNFIVTGNFVGGTAPNAGGAAWPVNTSISFYQFQAIRLNVGTVTPSSVQGNTVSNMVWKSTSFVSTLPGQWTGIYVVAGSVNIGTVTGNTIGSGAGNDSISLPTSATGGFAFGIGSSSSGTVAIANNVVGSMTMNPLGTNSSPTLIGIQVTAGANTITGNTVGSTTTTNSLNVPAPSTNATFVEQVTGILSTSSISAVITNNVVANLNSNYAGTVAGSQVRGIVTTAGVNTITGNTVRNLSTTSPVTGLGASSSVLGISQTSGLAGQTVSRNVIHSMSNTAASADVKVTGIFYSGAATGTNVIAGNLIHSLAVASTSTSSGLRGLDFGAGAFTVQNNMVRLGLDAAGASTGGAAGVYGIVDNNSVNGRNFFHNTILVSGTETSGSVTTTAFLSLGAGNIRSFQNNIFANVRTNAGGNGFHYPVRYSGTGVNPVGLTASNNLFFMNSGGALGSYNGVLQVTLAGWQAATGQDAASAVADPLFVNATGTAATVDLHVQPGSPANNGGVPIAGITVDYDGQARSATAPDIGADEFISNNANLSALVLSSGALTPAFSSGATNYTATVSNATTALTATPTLADPNATVTVNSSAVTSGSASGLINLNVGGNTVTVVVTAQDLTTTKTYTVTVTRLSVFQEWAAANGVTNDPQVPGANGIGNLLNFAFGVDPVTGGSGGLVFNGTFGAGGTIGATGQPITMLEPTANGVDFRALFVRRRDFAAAGLTYTPQFSASMASWTISAAVPTVLADDGMYQIVSVPYPPFIGGKKARFFRVSVTQP